MAYTTSSKVAVLGAAGAVGSNIVQSLLATGTASCVTMYDPFTEGLEGAAAEIHHCGFPDAVVTWTTDVAEALADASFCLLYTSPSPRD